MYIMGKKITCAYFLGFQVDLNSKSMVNLPIKITALPACHHDCFKMTEKKARKKKP